MESLTPGEKFCHIGYEMHLLHMVTLYLPDLFEKGTPARVLSH